MTEQMIKKDAIKIAQDNYKDGTVKEDQKLKYQFVHQSAEMEKCLGLRHAMTDQMTQMVVTLAVQAPFKVLIVQEEIQLPQRFAQLFVEMGN